jgi:NAD(P)-dependent dehydrogenase (short-subunit alcohol dehydrogenase family)
LVTGVSGNVGWGVAHALLADGANVVGITRSKESGEAVAASLGNSESLSIEIGDLSDAASAIALRDRILEKEKIDHVVAALGPWWQKGPIVEQTLEEYATVRAGLQDAHVHAAMAFIPSLRNREGSSYTIITGLGAKMTITGTGLLVVAASAVLGLSRMLREEHKSDALRVNEVLITTRIEKQPRNGVVFAPDFGAKLAQLLKSETRSSVLTYDGTELLEQS